MPERSGLTNQEATEKEEEKKGLKAYQQTFKVPLELTNLNQPHPLHTAPAFGDHTEADDRPHDGVRPADGHPGQRGNQVPNGGADEGGEEAEHQQLHLVVVGPEVDHPISNGAADVVAHADGAGYFEDRGEDARLAEGENLGREKERG